MYLTCRYFSQGVPLVLYTSLPFCIYGAFKLKHTHKRQFFWMCFAVTIVLSFQDHKEFRFLLPLLAPMQIYAGRALYLIHKADINNGRTGIKSLLTRCLVFMSLANFILALYFSRIHKRGVVQVVEWIRRQAYYSRYNKLVDNSVTHTKVESVLFLMPCHSTPFYSTVHLEIPMRYVTCEPPLGYFLFREITLECIEGTNRNEACTRTKQIYFIPIHLISFPSTFQNMLETRRWTEYRTILDIYTLFKSMGTA